MSFTPINERLCILRVKGRFFNYSLINIYARTNDSDDELKALFYEELERAYSTFPGNDVKIVTDSRTASM
jgi:hypothetical protein